MSTNVISLRKIRGLAFGIWHLVRRPNSNVQALTPWLIIAVLIAVFAASPASAQKTQCLDQEPTLGGYCTSESICENASTRDVYPGTNCESQGKVCCMYTQAFVATLRQRCTSDGGTCRSSCRPAEAANETDCPGSDKCCVAQTCDDLAGDCMASSQCVAGGGAASNASGCSSGQVCCVTKSAGTAKPAGTQVLPGAQTGSGKGKTTVAYGLKNPMGSRSLNDIAAALIMYASGIAGALMMFYMIWGGVQYMTASDPKSVQDAQKRIVWAILGIAVIFFAYVLIDAVIGLAGLAPS
jgi:hypothetical protein